MYLSCYNLVILYTITSAASVDCPKVINLALGLHMDIKQPSIMATLRTDCCSAGSLVCNTNERVTEIDWSILSLNGVVNGSALPPFLIRISVSQNSIVGQLPTSYPSTLTYLSVRGNKMSGDVPLFPDTLTAIRLGYLGSPGNHFTGGIYITGPIEDLKINDNWITDVIITDTSQLSSNCDLSNNPLLGNPNLANLGFCTKTGIYSASLLPKSLSALKTSTPQIISTFSFLSIILKSTLSSTSISTSSSLTSQKESIESSNTIFNSIILVSSDSISTANHFKIAPKSHSLTTLPETLVRFKQITSQLTIDLLLQYILKVLINSLIVMTIIKTAPIKREFRTKIQKIKSKKKTNKDDFDFN